MGGIFAQTWCSGRSAWRSRSPTTARTARSTASDRCPWRNGAVLGGHAVANLLRSDAADHPHVALRPDRRLADQQRGRGRGPRLRPDARRSRSPSSGWACCLAACCARRRRCRASAFAVLFPVTFIASTFVPVGDAAGRVEDDRGMEPGHRPWPRRCASCSATRGGEFGRRRPWPMQHPVAYSCSGSWASCWSARRSRSAPTGGPRATRGSGTRRARGRRGAGRPAGSGRAGR